MQLKRSLRLNHFLVVGLLIGFAGCRTLFDSEEQERADAQRQWQRSNIRSYSFEMRRGCFCPPEITEWARVTVQNGVIIGVTSLTGTALSGIARDSRLTVDQLFAAVKRPYPEWVAHVDFTFDAVYGYPLRLHLESKPDILDAGLVYEARNLQPFIPVD
jgi:hypothetical protein